MPRKVRRLALRSALTAKVNAGELVVLEEMNFPGNQDQKTWFKFLEGFKAADAKALVVMAEAKRGRNQVRRKHPWSDYNNDLLGINVHDHFESSACFL